MEPLDVIIDCVVERNNTDVPDDETGDNSILNGSNKGKDWYIGGVRSHKGVDCVVLTTIPSHERDELSGLWVPMSQFTDRYFTVLTERKIISSGKDRNPDQFE